MESMATTERRMPWPAHLLVGGSQLLGDLPEGITLVTESGIHTGQDVARMREQGVHAFLVGEAFMRAPDPGEALARLFAG